MNAGCAVKLWDPIPECLRGVLTTNPRLPYLFCKPAACYDTHPMVRKHDRHSNTALQAHINRNKCSIYIHIQSVKTGNRPNWTTVCEPVLMSSSTCSNGWQQPGSKLRGSTAVGGPTQLFCMYSWRQLTPRPKITNCLQFNLHSFTDIY